MQNDRQTSIDTKEKEKTKRRKKHHKEQRPTVIHLNQLGSTTAVDTMKLRDGELGQILETLATDTAKRSQTRREQFDSTKKDKIEFMTKCRSLIQTVILGPIEADTDKPLEKSYHLFESVVLTL